MRIARVVWTVAVAAGVVAVPALAQEHATPAKAAAPVRRSPVIAPGQPIVAPRIGPASISGPIPAAAGNPQSNRVTVSARQAAEQTIAALVAAMKTMPKRPPAPPEPRSAAARRAAAAGSRTPAFDEPPRIDYHVTWPSKPEEAGPSQRVELAWPGASTGGVALRWNEPTQPVP